jgi:hypothetical protein
VAGLLHTGYAWLGCSTYATTGRPGQARAGQGGAGRKGGRAG